MAGIVWPLDGKGLPSSSAVGKRVFCAAMRAAGAEAAAAAVERENDWRHKYVAPVLALADAMMGSSAACLRGADAGLAALHAEFEFELEGGERVPLTEAMEAPRSSLATVAIAGDGSAVTSCYESLFAEVSALAAYGSLELSVVKYCKSHLMESGGSALTESTLFVILGATSEMGPTRSLLAAGASVAAVCRGGPKWEQLATWAKTARGSLYAPLKQGAQQPGADVIADAPAIAEWAFALAQEQGLAKVCVGAYIYLDGEAHVRACVACDVIAQRVAQLRAQAGHAPHTLSLAFLASPGTAYCVDADAVQDSKRRLAQTPAWQSVMSGLARVGGGGFVPNARAPIVGEDGRERFVTNGLSVVQGPNYALAKTLQNWRCVAAYRDGHVVSANMAPPAKTQSMTAKNSAIAQWLKGIKQFEPCQAFAPNFVAPIMTALLFHDLSVPRPDYSHPMELLWDGAFHGGSVRCAYTGDSVGTSAVLVSFVT